MPDGEDEALREAAAHRGLKLVKSRRRKEGVGDYGLYGLTDGGGKELLGIGPDGLTATPAEIRDYLRKSEVSTWAQSAEVTPDRPKPDRMALDKAAADDGKGVEDVPFVASDGDQEMPKRRSARKGRRPRLAAASAKSPVADAPATPTPEADRQPAREPEPAPAPEPVPEQVLAIREASKSDLEAIRALVGDRSADAFFAARFRQLKRTGGGVIVAERGKIVGCVAWHVILGLQADPIGRLTLLVVAEDHRRQGVGRTLVDGARAAMADQGCEMMEAISDIAVRNANGFYRTVGLEQRSYRFVGTVHSPEQSTSE